MKTYSYDIYSDSHYTFDSLKKAMQEHFGEDCTIEGFRFSVYQNDIIAYVDISSSLSYKEYVELCAEELLKKEQRKRDNERSKKIQAKRKEEREKLDFKEYSRLKKKFEGKE